MHSYARQNPIKSVVGSFALLAGLGLLVNLTMKTVLKDTNPSYTIMNVPHTALEVYNKEDEMLWQLPDPDIKEFTENEKVGRIYHTNVSDLRGNGQNEVITTLPLPNERNGGTKVLRVYGSDKSILFQNQFMGTKVDFLSSHYQSDFYFEGVLVNKFGENDEKEILTGADNGRSPWFLARFDAEGKLLGRFWHFGQMGRQYDVRLNGSSKRYVLLCGVNQIRDIEKDQFAVVEVIDPQKIVGDAEASATRGFGFDVSTAELFYIRIPESDMETTLGLTPAQPILLSTDNEQQIRIVTSRKAADGELPCFEYVLSRDMHMQDVKFENQDIGIHAALKKAGKISSIFDRIYLEKLKNGIRYWDGRSWKKEWTKVKHDLAPDQ